MSRGTRGVVCLVLCAALVTGGSVAHASDPSGVSAADQYRETIPTSSGPAVEHIAPQPAPPLPPAQAVRIEKAGGRDKPILKRIATPTSYGAPRQERPLPQLAPIRTEPPSVGRSLDAVPAALDSAFGSTRVLVLLGLLGATILAALFLRRPDSG